MDRLVRGRTRRAAGRRVNVESQSGLLPQPAGLDHRYEQPGADDPFRKGVGQDQSGLERGIQADLVHQTQRAQAHAELAGGPIDHGRGNAFPQQFERRAEIGEQHPVDDEPRSIADHDRRPSEPPDVGRRRGDRAARSLRATDDLDERPLLDRPEKVEAAEPGRIGRAVGKPGDRNRRTVRRQDRAALQMRPQFGVQLPLRRQALHGPIPAPGRMPPARLGRWWCAAAGPPSAAAPARRLLPSRRTIASAAPAKISFRQSPSTTGRPPNRLSAAMDRPIIPAPMIPTLSMAGAAAGGRALRRVPMAPRQKRREHSPVLDFDHTHLPRGSCCIRGPACSALIVWTPEVPGQQGLDWTDEGADEIVHRHRRVIDDVETIAGQDLVVGSRLAVAGDSFQSIGIIC